MLTVHHLNNSRSQRVLWLLEELGVPHEIVRYQRQPDMRAPKELRAIHPLGKSPVITDNGNTIAESGAIVEYLVGTYGNGRFIPPPNTPERLRYTYWLHYAEGSAMPPLLLKLLFTLMPKRAPALLRPLVRKVSNQALATLVNPQLKQHMAYWEDELGKSEWFAGHDFTAADIQMSAAGSRTVIRRRWRFSIASTRGRRISARWRRAGRTWWDADFRRHRGSSTSGSSRESESAAVRCPMPAR
jgi:glutathione S-transferase